MNASCLFVDYIIPINRAGGISKTDIVGSSIKVCLKVGKKTGNRNGQTINLENPRIAQDLCKTKTHAEDSAQVKPCSPLVVGETYKFDKIALGKTPKVKKYRVTIITKSLVYKEWNQIFVKEQKHFRVEHFRVRCSCIEY